MKTFLHKFWQRWWFAFTVALIAIGIFFNVYVAIQPAQQHLPDGAQLPPTYTGQSTTAPSHQSQPAHPSRSTQLASNQTSTPGDRTPQLGHFPYQEGDFNKMLPVGSYAQGEDQRFEYLMPDATFALMKLIYAARDEGVWIVPVSCFRNLDSQQKLFVAQVRRRGSPEAAAKSSAPPGYSEHHTGYALDLTDGHFPKQDISLEFARTEAFKWMKLHAREFGFELSFPENNSQGINYEPWHWRFIGTAEATKIFRHAP